MFLQFFSVDRDNCLGKKHARKIFTKFLKFKVLITWSILSGEWNSIEAEHSQVTQRWS